ncbi:hypothetical protein IGI04_008011, partial [Brassica rapa subsp. trilocularis]
YQEDIVPFVIHRTLREEKTHFQDFETQTSKTIQVLLPGIALRRIEHTRSFSKSGINVIMF